LIRKDKLELNNEILDLTFKSCDYLRNIINSKDYQKDHIEEFNELNIKFENLNIKK
jgi:chemotaxis protein histidine kinase CheA